jgi:hypothetical protein
MRAEECCGWLTGGESVTEAGLSEEEEAGRAGKMPVTGTAAC